MGALFIKGKQVNSVFQLLGSLENDITKSIAWVLCNCPSLSKNIFESILEKKVNPDNIQIYYQKGEGDKGITDLEVTDDNSFYLIIEAKRGWILPSEEQLTKYSERYELQNCRYSNKAIVSMSECSDRYANEYLPKVINNIPVKHLSWEKIYNLAEKSKTETNIKQKNLLNELLEYFREIMTTQNKESNWVYVVSLSKDNVARDCELTYIDVVEKKGKYFHPMGKNWPTPPNYIAFRYKGCLQSIHHIKSYVVTRNMHDEIPEMPDEEWDTPHYVYTLDPAIIPNKKIRTGNLYRAQRVWAMLDLLLTSDSISDASNFSKDRMNNN